MIINKKNGFVIILVVSLSAVLILTATVIVNYGCSELMTTRVRNDLLISAYYVAISGAELMYAQLKSSSTITWDPSISGSISVGSNTIGSYSTIATQTGAEEFCIVSTGTVNGRTAKATVMYGYLSSFNGPVPLGAIGAITLNGASNPAKLIMDGPVVSGSTVTESGSVNIANGTVEGATLPAISFWLGTPFDTNNDGSYVEDSDSSGTVTRAEAVTQGKESIFDADNAYDSSDDEITAKDAFYYYYTTYLNDPANNKLGSTLNIGPGQSRYYSGNQSFGQGDVPNNVPIIFVDGDVAINYNDQDWQGSGTLDHTIVATGSMTVVQPTNRPGDVMTFVAWGGFTTTGEMGDKGGTIGDIVVYTNGDFTATDGGKSNVSIYANGTATINTVGDDQGKDHRVVRLLTVVWDSEDDKPLGLPPNYPANMSFGFNVKNQTNYPPIWQRE